MSTPISRPGVADLLGGEETVEARTTGEVENSLSGLELGDRPRIAAPQTQIGASRHRRQVVGGVAQLDGHRLPLLLARPTTRRGRAAAAASVEATRPYDSTDLVTLVGVHAVLLVAGTPSSLTTMRLRVAKVSEPRPIPAPTPI